MDDLEKQVQDELAAITNALESILGRRSRWNGEVELSDDASTFGKALWNGRVVINRQTAQSGLRWRTEIHEALHLFSIGLTSITYAELPGWEEAKGSTCPCWRSHSENGLRMSWRRHQLSRPRVYSNFGGPLRSLSVC